MADQPLGRGQKRISRGTKTGALCCSAGARVLSLIYSPPSLPIQDGQHDSDSVYKSPMGYELAAAAAGRKIPSVGRSTPPLHSGFTCPRDA